MAFLDLELSHYNSDIIAKGYTKPSAGNSFLHYQSCHFPKWIDNIPKSQFCRLRRNCSRVEDYMELSGDLKKKFQDKGFPDDLVNNACQLYLDPDKNKNKQICQRNNNNEVFKTIPKFITQFHTKYRRMEKSLAKHWSILLEDPHLQQIIPAKPKIIYRKGKSVKSSIAPSKLKTTQKSPLQSLCLIPLTGMFQCRKILCLTCKHVNHGQKDFYTKGKKYMINNFFNCSSEYVIYALTCPCGLLYIGRTIRTLRKRFGEHRRFVEKMVDKHSVPRHFKEHHSGSLEGLRVWVIESIPSTLPLAERFSRLCQRETYWIYTLDSLAPGGLNEDIETNQLV